MKTIVNFILDETGSMNACREATVSGFNEYVEGLKKQKEVFFSLTRFNGEKVEVEYSDVPIDEVKELDDYEPNACTPLYDAIGRTITKVSAKLKKSKKEKHKVLCIIMTDGEENASREYTRERIFKLIKEKEKEKWSFVYLGADQDAWANSQAIGLSRGNTRSYHSAETSGMLKDLCRYSIQYSIGDAVKTDNFFGEADKK